MSLVAVAASAQDTILDGPLLAAILVSVAAGLVSFFSPCCLPLVPGYLSYVAGLSGAETTEREGLEPAPPQPAEAVAAAGTTQEGSPASTQLRELDASLPTSPRARAQTPTRKSRRERRRTLWGGLLFVLGFSVVFTSYGAAFGAFGAFLIDYQEPLVKVLGAVTIVLGLVFAGVLWRLPFTGRTFRLSYRPSVGLGGAPLLGVLFGLGWTPCIGPTLAAVLTLATTSAGADRGAVLSLAYSLGLGIPFVVAGASMQRVVGSFAWARRHAHLVMRTGGAFLVIIGLLQVTGAWTALIANLQGVISSWQPPL